MIFSVVTLTAWLMLWGIYLITTNRKSRLQKVILGDDQKSTFRLSLGLINDTMKPTLFALLFFGAGWFLVGGVKWGIILALCGLMIPLVTRGSGHKKLIRKMEKQLEDVLYQGTNVLRGGGGLYQFVAYLASDKTPEPLHEMFRSAFSAIEELGVPPIEALKKVSKENPDLKDLHLMASVLEEAEKNGADLAEVVEMFATDLRNRRMMQQEIETKTAQGVFTANFLLGMGVGVPALLKVFSYVSKNPTLAGGHSFGVQLTTTVCYILMMVGFLLIRRMVRV